MQNLRSLKSATFATGAIVALMFTTPFGAPAAQAQSNSLSGSWGGGGRIVFPSGETERARCRARFHAHGRHGYRMNAICATSSTRVEQTAQVRRVGGNTYRGDFFNEQHGIAGTIRITVKGGRLSALLRGGGGSAEFHLGR